MPFLLLINITITLFLSVTNYFLTGAFENVMNDDPYHVRPADEGVLRHLQNTGIQHMRAKAYKDKGREGNDFNDR